MLADVWALTLKDKGRSPHMSDFRKYGMPVSAWTVTNRFGTWRKALIEASQLSESDQKAAQHGANPPRRAASFATSHSTFGVMPSPIRCRTC